MYNRIKKNYHLFLEKYQINKKINDIRLGINKANSLKTLPIKWDNFHNHIITRIVRFILGVITGIGLINMNKTIIPTYGYDFTIDIIMLINFIYITSVLMTRLIYIIKILYNKEYEIRNSPLNYLGSKVGNIWLCVKGIYTVIGTSGGILGGLVIYDNIIERTGRNRIFMPKIEYVTDKILTKIGINKNESADNEELIELLKINSMYDSSKNFIRYPNEDNILSKINEFISQPFQLIENFSAIQSFALSILLFTLVTISSIITIIIFVLNTYLLERYKISEKYPRVYKFIVYYRNISYISVLWSIFIYILCIVIIIVMCVWFIING